MERPQALLVAIEGVDAVGKRTQSSLLTAWLRSRNIATSMVSFPDYGTVIGREIKSYLHGDRSYSSEVGHMLYAVNRWEKKGEIEKLLASSDVVVVNRYSPSNFAYGTARGLKLSWLMGLEEGLPKADLVLVLDAPPSALTTRRGPGRDNYERNIPYQERVRHAYLQLSRELGWTTVNAALGIQSTSQLIAAAVSEALAARGKEVEGASGGRGPP
jgi:dTMP kinase